jgi:hypothetical protein
MVSSSLFGEWRHPYHVQTKAKSTTAPSLIEDNQAVRSEVRPSEIGAAVKSEYRRIFTERRDDLIAVSFNALLVTVCWFLLPTNILNWLFTLHGALAFPYFLEMWMLGDTPATNVAGRDAVRALAQLHDPAALRAWLRAKHIVLWSFVGPIGAIVAIVIGLVQHRYDAAAAVAITLLFLPLGVLSVAAWVGLWLPYHPRKLLWRWQHRSDWRASLLRWGVLVLLPFLVVPVIAVLLLIPSLIIWIIAHQGYPPQHMATAGLWLGTVVSVAVSLITFAFAPRVTVKIARRRLGTLHGYLSDPDHG